MVESMERFGVRMKPLVTLRPDRVILKVSRCNDRSDASLLHDPMASCFYGNRLKLWREQ